MQQKASADGTLGILRIPGARRGVSHVGKIPPQPQDAGTETRDCRHRASEMVRRTHWAKSHGSTLKRPVCRPRSDAGHESPVSKSKVECHQSVFETGFPNASTGESRDASRGTCGRKHARKAPWELCKFQGLGGVFHTSTKFRHSPKTRELKSDTADSVLLRW